MPKRFSEAEAQRIFALAAERQHERGQEDTGLSLEELEEVGRAAGLDPAFVREAAIDALRPETTGTTRRVFGMPLEYRRERFVRGPISDDAWAEIVRELRGRFNKPGLVTDIGKLREWRSDTGINNQPVMVTLTPERDGTRVVIEQSQAQVALGLGIAFGTNALLGLVFLFFSMVETGNPKLMTPAAILLAFSAVFALIAVFGMRNHSRRQTTAFDAVLDKIDLAVRDTAALAEATAEPERVAPPAESARLDASLLETPASNAAPVQPGRQRDRA